MVDNFYVFSKTQSRKYFNFFGQTVRTIGMDFVHSTEQLERNNFYPVTWISTMFIDS